MSNKSSSITELSPKFFIIILIAGLLPWFALHIQLSLNGDIVWLITAAERMLAGLSMTENYYEVNPPLSILYNLPPVILGKILPFPIHYVIVFYFLALIALAGWVSYKITSLWDFISRDERFIILAGFLIANTVIVTVSIGERDQIVILGLLPFMLAQIGMTWGYKQNNVLFWAVMILGTIAVLIKPHFGLLPTLLLIHRMIVQKRFFSIMRDADFLALAIGTLSYVGIIIIFFQDFVHDVLPGVIDLYLPNKSPEYAIPQLMWHVFLFAVFLGLEAAFTPLEGQRKKLLVLLYAGALLALIPFAVQMKAYYYHLIPAIALFYCAFGMSVYSYTSIYLKRFKHVGALALIILFAMAYTNRPLMLEFPKHDDYSTFELTKEIQKCEEPCEVFMFNDNIEVMHPTFFYMGKENASRFPSLWFIPQLVKNPDKPGFEEYRVSFGDMLGEDLKNYDPKMLLIGQYWVIDEVEKFDYADFFSVSSVFKEQWKRYKKDRTITVNRKPYFAGTELGVDYPLTYDVYLRR